MQLIKVLIELPTSTLDTAYTYYADDSAVIFPYVRVKVSFGRMTLVALVVEIEKSQLSIEEYQVGRKYKIKPILEIIDTAPLLSPELIALGKHIKELTFTPLISCYQCLLPPALKPTRSKKAPIKYVNLFQAVEKPVSLSKKQMECYLFIKENGVLSKEDIPYSDMIIKALLKAGAVIKVKEEAFRYQHELKEEVVSFDLSAEQRKAVEIINKNDGPFLLFGVTGSGKTTVYIEIVNQVLREGKSAIILVPEISLTPQLIKVYRDRLEGEIAILHSGLSEGERFDEYRRLASGIAKVAIGTRSAIFAPVTRVGAIIIDEEHSASYKQTSMPRYHVRDIALFRATFYKAKLIFGSATPSIESYAYATTGRMQLIKMEKRVNNQSLPSARIIDMNEEAKSGNFSIISRQLDEAIRERLEKKEQIILLLNRRGYALSASCIMCGYNFSCPNCKVSLVFHKEEDILACHHCGYVEDLPKQCPACHSKQLNYYGVGTQRLEQLLKEQYPSARLLRFDADTTGYRNAHSDIVKIFEQQQADILFGTQMVAKGFNFENVTLIGVINAEQTLNQPHFRAAESTFQLLTQVIGRAGRFDKEGLALIQTYRPNHYAIVLSTIQDYQRFFNKEIKIRHDRSYPPFYKMIHVIFQGENSDHLFMRANGFKKELSQIPELLVGNPAFPYIKERDGIYQVRLVVRCKNINLIEEKLMNLIKQNDNIKVYVNVNPYEEV